MCAAAISSNHSLELHAHFTRVVNFYVMWEYPITLLPNLSFINLM